MPSWHSITVPDAPPKIATSLAGLGVGSYDGHIGICRIGAWPDTHQEEFIWSASASKWIGTKEYVVLSALDAWAMDWSRTPLAMLKSAKWCRPTGGVSWEILGPRAELAADVTFPAATISFQGDGAQGALPAAGKVLVRDVLVTYTGITGTAFAGTLTGCTVDSSYNGQTLPAQYTPIMPYNAFNGGDQGGWGTAVVMLDRVGELWAAGFRLEERLDGFFNGTPDLTDVDYAPWYLNVDLGQDLAAASNYPGIFQTADTVPNLVGPGVMVTSSAYDMGGYNKPGNHHAYAERGFERKTTPWTPWSAAAPTKRCLQPILYARHRAAVKGNGETYSLNLTLRWVSP